MVKKFLACGVMSLFVLSFAAILAFAADPGPAEITMGEGGKKPAVFPHKAHQDAFQCGDCHHGMDAEGKQVPYVDGQEIKKCQECHNPDVLAGKTKGNLALDTLKGAGHGNCLECHKEKVAADPAMKEKKLDKCDTCHPKK